MMRLRAPIYFVLVLAASPAVAMEYKCVVEHSLGIKLKEMKPARFKTGDYEYRVEPIAVMTSKLRHDYDVANESDPNVRNAKYAVRRTDREPNIRGNWTVLGSYTDKYHGNTWDGGTFERVHFDEDELRLVVNVAEPSLDWTLNLDPSLFPIADAYTDFAKCFPYFD